MFLPLLHQKARGKPDMKVNKLWALGMSSIKEQGVLLKTLAHQATQSGMLTRMVFSRVEIKCSLMTLGSSVDVTRRAWYLHSVQKKIDGSWNWETCLWTATRLVRRAHGQIYCWKQWHARWHQRRIRHVVIIQIILAQGEMLDCERYWTILQKMQHKTATNIL